MSTLKCIRKTNSGRYQVRINVEGVQTHVGNTGSIKDALIVRRLYSRLFLGKKTAKRRGLSN